MNPIIVEMEDWALSDVIVLAIKSGQRVDVNLLVDDVMEKSLYTCWQHRFTSMRDHGNFGRHQLQRRNKHGHMVSKILSLITMRG